MISSVVSLSSVERARAARSLAPVDPVRKVAVRGPGIELPKQQPAAVLRLSEEARELAGSAASGESTSSAASHSPRLPGSSSVSDFPGLPGAARGLPGAAPELPGRAADGSSTADPSEVAKTPLPGAAQPGEEDDAAEDPSELTEEEQQTVRELQARDQEVRTHEQTHKSVGGQYAGAINYDFQRGPDGQNYAVGGHVNIDVSPIANDPAATVAKMQQVMRAALAPAQPSGADRSVAAKASGRAAEARREMAQESSPAAKENEESDAARAGESGSDPKSAPSASSPAVGPPASASPSASSAAATSAGARDEDLGAVISQAFLASQSRMVA